MRSPPQRNLALEALLEDRDHLRIQINLLENGPGADPVALEHMRRELEAIESRISRHRSD